MISLLPLLRLNENKLGYLVINIIFILAFAIIYWIFGTYEHFKVLSVPSQKYLSFIDSLYLSFITHCTLGYGDIVPVSDSMKITIIFHTLFMIAYLFLVAL
jgi:voltage-gated potassium channel